MKLKNIFKRKKKVEPVVFMELRTIDGKHLIFKDGVRLPGVVVTKVSQNINESFQGIGRMEAEFVVKIVY